MKIKYKILLQFVFLIVLVSGGIIFTTIKLSEEGRKKIFNGVSDKLIELQEMSIAELEMAKIIANNGIVDASSLVAIDVITTMNIDNQHEFYDTVTEGIDRAGDYIIDTLVAQGNAIDESLDQLLAQATESVSTSMEQDSESFLVIANAALSNVGYLHSANLEGLQRFQADQEKYVAKLADLGDENNFDIDSFLVDIIGEQEHPGQETFKEIEHLVALADRLKKSIAARDGVFFKELFLSIDRQKRILSEEVRLAVENVKWAINQEREKSSAVQDLQLKSAIESLYICRLKSKHV